MLGRESVAQVRAEVAAMEWKEPMYVEGAGPEGRIEVLVIRGFGGSPRSMQELALLSRVVRSDLGRVTCAAPLFSSAVDHVVPPADQPSPTRPSGRRIRGSWSWPTGYHAATMDCGKERIFSGVLDFITAHA